MKTTILLNNLNTSKAKDFLQESCQKLVNNQLEKREHNNDNTTRKRNSYHRDYTRILYSSSFRRLQGKMQILGIQSDAFFRNRLTHSLEVSQIARYIAEQIGLVIGDDTYSNKNDIYVIEAAALAHDIGHPAFGHSGERILDKLNSCVRFEGNAQNYRILRTLEKKLPEETGLNLTYRTLLAINKYIVKEGDGIKKFMYRDDYNVLMDVRKRASLDNERTLDAQIIDIADEIAYAVHDLEDALSMRYFDIDELIYLLKKDTNAANEFQKHVDSAKSSATKAASYNTIQEYSQIFRKELVSELTNALIKDIGIVEVNEKDNKKHGTDVSQEIGFSRLKGLAQGLKKTIFECLQRRDDIALYEQRGKVVIQSLYKMFTDKEYNKEYNLLPPDYRTNAEKCPDRAVIDYIAGMMDTFASVYERHFGVKFEDIKYNE